MKNIFLDTKFIKGLSTRHIDFPTVYNTSIINCPQSSTSPAKVNCEWHNGDRYEGDW